MPYKDPERQKQAQHESYLRARQRDTWAEAQKESRRKRKQIIIDIKEKSPCFDCGIFYPHYVMDFDHRNPKEKVETIARMISLVGVSKILEEIEKCDLVCANCHRIRTHIRGHNSLPQQENPKYRKHKRY